MKNSKNISKLIYGILIVIYLILGLISLNFVYFGDNIMQISKSAHWYYLNDFQYFLTPKVSSGSDLAGTGYHPPILGLIVAFLWKIIGYHLWIYHSLAIICFFLLIYNLKLFLKNFFKEEYIPWIVAIIMLEPTVMAQFAVASPDFILYTAFFICLRAIFDKKKLLFSCAFFFLCAISMRGIFTGISLFIVHFLYVKIKQLNNNQYIIRWSLAYLPTFILLSLYFIIYFMNRGWFFNDSIYTEHYQQPKDFHFIIKHFFSFVLRAIENGRFFIWTLFLVFLPKIWKERIYFFNKIGFIILLFLALYSIYFIFIFISQMPFTSRYFLPQYSLLTILMAFILYKYLPLKKLKIIFIITLLLELTGNFWIYPEKTAVAWDGTLAHLPFYNLRKECFNYIDSQKINYPEINAGFCLYGKRKYIEMINSPKSIEGNTNGKYYIYSNISNESDELIQELNNKNKWKKVKQFQQWPVHIIIYKKIN